MEPNKKQTSYKIGYVCGCIVLLCIMAIFVALTAKFIMWIF